MSDPLKEVNLGTTVVVLMRVVGVSQVPIVQASVDSCSRVIVNLGQRSDDAPAIVGDVATIVIADSVFDSPQTDYGWTRIPGYNFRDEILASAVGKWVVQYTFLDTNGLPMVWVESFVVVNRKGL